jgi:hypothetical protein
MKPGYTASLSLRAATLAAGAIFLSFGSARAQFHAGVAGGYAASVTADGLSGFGDTKLGPTTTRAGSVGYRFSNGLASISTRPL